MISGFLITGHLLREYRKTGTVALLDFWGRRAKRLLPAAALVLTVTWVASRAAAARDPAGGRPPRRSGRARCTSRTGSWPGTRSTTSSRTARRARCSTSGRSRWRSSSTWAGRCCSSSRRWRALHGRAAAARRPRNGRRSAATARARGHLVMFLLAAAVVAGSLWYSVYYTRANPAGAYFVTTTRIWELGLGGLLALLPARVSQRMGRFGLLGWAGLGLVVASAFVAERHARLPRLPGPAARGRRRGADPRRLGGGTLRAAPADVRPADGVHRRHLLLAVPVALAGHRAVHRLVRPCGRRAFRLGHRRGRRSCWPG